MSHTTEAKQMLPRSCTRKEKGNETTVTVIQRTTTLSTNSEQNYQQFKLCCYLIAVTTVKTQDLNNVQSDIKNTNIDNPCYIVANCVAQ